jgi:hypothetical protein
MDKHRFWTGLYRKSVSSKEDHEIKSQVQNVGLPYSDSLDLPTHSALHLPLRGSRHPQAHRHQPHESAEAGLSSGGGSDPQRHLRAHQEILGDILPDSADR